MTIFARRFLQLLLPLAVLSLLLLPGSPLTQRHAQASAARANVAPSPSGAAAAYPLNHVLDSNAVPVGTPPANNTFETPASMAGTPPANSDLSQPMTTAGTPASNADFESVMTLT